jgi:hypothetical protein
MALRARPLVGLLLCAACAPDFEDQPYLVEHAELLAVVAEPAEVRPGAEVVLTPVVAGRRLVAGDLAYHFCTRAPDPADPRPVSEACLDEEGAPLKAGSQVARGNVPVEACARFGPDPIGSAFRPQDADSTGGFYQPIVVTGLGQTSVALLRITCPLPDAPIDLARQLQTSYVANQNPAGLRLEAAMGDGWGPFTSAVASAPIDIRVSWHAAARETYVWLPPDGTELENRKEGLRISWFMTSGSVAAATTAQSERDPLDESGNTFNAPTHVGSQELWAVVHDDRGGTAIVHQTIDVRER